MGIEENTSLLHWNYFLALEADIENLARYVEFTNDNLDTYSMEIAHILLASSSEVDVVAKLLCRDLDASDKSSKITQYKEVIMRYLPDIATSKISLPRYGLELAPWSNWSGDKNPIWWTSYNDVKHKRNINFNKANLKNVLNSMAGLFLLLIYHYRNSISSIEQPPSIFRPPSDLATIGTVWGGSVELCFTK